jgi:hypothetical protein
MPKDRNNTVPNFYTIIDDKYKNPIETYPNYDKVRINIPFRMLIVGSAGSFKTNTLLHLISSINAFDKIYIFAKELDQPLYRFLISHLNEAEKESNEKIVFSYDNLDELPEEFDKKHTNLVIFDDMVNADRKTYAKIANVFCKGRHQNASVIFISQSYFAIPKIIRQNVSYIILKKIESSRDLKMIIKEHTLSTNVDNLLRMYKYASEGTDFFMLDLIDSKLKYRKNFKRIMNKHLEF